MSSIPTDSQKFKMDEGDPLERTQPTNQLENAAGADGGISAESTHHQEGQEMKRRRIQMDDHKCLQHSRTNTGALPLTNPAMVKSSSKDVNRGLYPRQPKPKHNSSKTHSLGNSHHHASVRIPAARSKAASNSQSAHFVKDIRSFGVCSPKSSPNKDLKMSSIVDNHSEHARKHVTKDIRSFGVCSPKKASTAPYSSPNKDLKMSKVVDKHTGTTSTAVSDNLLIKFDNDTTLNTPNVVNQAGAARNMACANAATISDKLLNEFENDMMYDTTEVLSLVEKAESDTSSPCKSLQGRDRDSLSKKPRATNASGHLGDPMISDEFENDTTFDTIEVLNLVEKAESDTSSPCKGVQRGSSSHSKKPHAPNTFGLLGDPILISDEEDDEDWDVGVDMFSMLPIEVMENIFCNMPILDLSLGVNLVCTSWNKIIKREEVIIHVYNFYQF